ncbi:MAG TPA: hypothetical protein VIY86_07860 [Pirellulaceae bacterium]
MTSCSFVDPKKFLFLLSVLVPTHALIAAEWGNLSGTFVYDGALPNPTPIRIDKDVEVCGKHKLVDESLTVNSGNKGIANVVIYLSLDRGADEPAVHESYQSTANDEVTIDNEGCRFEPHIVLLRTTQTLVIGNKDPVGHNTKVDTLKNVAINPIVPANASIKQKFPDAERLPSRVSCSIHTWMGGWVLIKDDPYFAITDADGHFEIPNVPVGKWTFQVWHEANGGTYLKEVSRGGKGEKWKKGKVDVDVKAGDNDLGTITVPASLFGR